MKNQPDTSEHLPVSPTKNKLRPIIIAVLCFAIFFGGAFLWYSNSSKVSYKPTEACTLLTNKEAADLIKGNVVNSVHSEAAMADNMAISKCGYTNRDPDINNMLVAAVIVRSGINDDGVAQNETEFLANKKAKEVESVKNIGDDAYYNPVQGQLNVLTNRNWIIMSYGVGATPELNTLKDALLLADKVVDSSSAKF